MRTSATLITILAATSVAVDRVHAETPDSLDARIQRFWLDHTSVTAKIHEEKRGERIDGHIHKVADGTVRHLRVADRILTRLELDETETFTPVEGDPDIEKRRTVRIDDGRHTIRFVERSNTAGRWLDGGALDPRRVLATFRESYEFLVTTREDPGDGEIAYVAQGTLHRTSMGSKAGVLLSFRQDGALLEIRRFNHRGELAQHTTMTEIELDKPMEAKLFEFTPPPGVTVKDLQLDERLPGDKTDRPQGEPQRPD